MTEEDFSNPENTDERSPLLNGQINDSITPSQINGSITPSQINGSITPSQTDSYENVI
jgi:hypothetical protein